MHIWSKNLTYLDATDVLEYIAKIAMTRKHDTIIFMMLFEAIKEKFLVNVFNLRCLTVDTSKFIGEKYSYSTSTCTNVHADFHATNDFFCWKGFFVRPKTVWIFHYRYLPFVTFRDRTSPYVSSALSLTKLFSGYHEKERVLSMYLAGTVLVVDRWSWFSAQKQGEWQSGVNSL